jgi:hypothetical protein
LLHWLAKAALPQLAGRSEVQDSTPVHHHRHLLTLAIKKQALQLEMKTKRCAFIIQLAGKRLTESVLALQQHGLADTHQRAAWLIPQ